MNNTIKKIPLGKFCMVRKCYVCNGTGVDFCARCNGNKTFNGETCPDCDGKGVVDCYKCSGRGIIDE